MSYDDTCDPCEYLYKAGPLEVCRFSLPQRLCEIARSTCNRFGAEAAKASTTPHNKRKPKRTRRASAVR